MDNCLNLEEVFDEASKLRSSALKHAAEISPFITERTLGAGRKLCSEEEPNESEEGLEDNENGNKTEGATETSKSTPIHSSPEANRSPKRPLPKLLDQDTPTPKAIQPMDEITLLPASFGSSSGDITLECVNLESLILRNAKVENKTVRQQVLELQQQRLRAQAAYISPEKTSPPGETKLKWLQQRLRETQQLAAQAEVMAKADLQSRQTKLSGYRQNMERKLHLYHFQIVLQCHKAFRLKYEVVVRLLTSLDEPTLAAFQAHNLKLKELIEMFEQLFGKIKSGECGVKETRIASNLCKTLNELDQNISEEVQKKFREREDRLEAEAAAKREQEKLQAEQEQQRAALEQASAAAAVSEVPAAAVAEVAPQPTQQPAVEQSPAPNQAATTAEPPNPFVSPERLQFYERINAIYQEKVERVKPLQADETFKKWRTACQRAINVPVNAISAVSPQHLQDKYDKLHNFLAGQSYKLTETQAMSVNDHPLGRDYCLLLMAKKFVSQGDTAVSSNPQAAFPVASVIVSLWQAVPDFGCVFLAYVFKESPFLVPYFIPQRTGQSAEEYYKVLGYRMADGQLEQQDMFLKRQAGIARLYAAVMITNGSRSHRQRCPHPFSIDQGWRWLANFVTLSPLPDICATLILEMLQIIGADMWAAYGAQFVKLLAYVQREYFPKLSAVDEGGPKARLELLLGKFLKEGQIPKPLGLLPNDFW